MGEKNRFPKPVGFNRKNETDQKILNHVEELDNFSGYVKALILADIEKRNQPLRIVQRTRNGGIKYVEKIDITPPPSQEIV